MYNCLSCARFTLKIVIVRIRFDIKHLSATWFFTNPRPLNDLIFVRKSGLVPGYISQIQPVRKIEGFRPLPAYIHMRAYNYTVRIREYNIAISITRIINPVCNRCILNDICTHINDERKKSNSIQFDFDEDKS